MAGRSGKHNTRAAVTCIIGGILLLIGSYKTNSLINYVPGSVWVAAEEHMPMLDPFINGLFFLSSLGIASVFLGSVFIYIKQKPAACILIGIGSGVGIFSIIFLLISLFSGIYIGIPVFDLLLYTFSTIGITGLGIIIVAVSMWT